MSDRVRIVGDHPHKGEAGTIVKGGSIKMRYTGTVMHKVALDTSWTNGCYVEEKNLQDLSSEEDPRA